MKRLVPMLIVLFFILPFGTTFANGKLVEIESIQSEDTIDLTKWTDSDFSTFNKISGGKWTYLTLKNESNIVNIFFDGNPTGNTQVVRLLDKNGVTLLSTGYPNGSLNGKDLDYKGVKKIGFYSDSPWTIFEARFYTDIIEYFGIAELTEEHNSNTITLNWKNPQSTLLKGTKVILDGVELITLDKALKTYVLKGLEPDKTYKVSFVSEYPNGQSEPVSITVKTNSLPPPPKDAGEVSVLTANASHKRVDLSWTLPDSNNFKNVIIYRDVVSKSLFNKLMGVSTVKAATPIFETNGTYFNDLTVQAETKYNYTLTTLSVDKVESNGVSVMVETLKNPKPEIGGGGYDKNPDSGDYTYYWTEPTTGKVKVMVGGKLFNTVLASAGKIVIPSADMKYSILGNPDVTLIPVDEDGNEGKPVKPPLIGGGGDGGLGGVDSLPFEVNELMKTTFSLLLLLSGVILVALAIELTPRLVKVIKNSIAQKGAIK